MVFSIKIKSFQERCLEARCHFGNVFLCQQCQCQSGSNNVECFLRALPPITSLSSQFLFFSRNHGPNPGIPSQNPSKATTSVCHWSPWSPLRDQSQSSLRSASVLLKRQVRISSTSHNKEHRCLMASIREQHGLLFSVIQVLSVVK